MIKFKQFITEARMAPLYHGTTISRLPDILKSGIEPRTFQRGYKLLMTEDKIGVSTSRSLKFAQSWSIGLYKCVLELDQSALAQRYKIKPIQYFQPEYKSVYKTPARITDYTGTNNEYEEFVITNKSIPAKYINRILISRNVKESPVQTVKVVISKNVEIIEHIRQQYGSSFIGYID